MYGYGLEAAKNRIAWRRKYGLAFWSWDQKSIAALHAEQIKNDLKPA